MEKFHYLVNKILFPLLLPAANIAILMAIVIFVKIQFIRFCIRLAA
jgi:hypothetical protein